MTGKRVRLERVRSLAGGTDPEATGPLHWGVDGVLVAAIEVGRRVVILRVNDRIVRTTIVCRVADRGGWLEVETANSVYRVEAC